MKHYNDNDNNNNNNKIYVSYHYFGISQIAMN